MERIADIVQCSVCLETFTDPRMLPCIHTFCLKCLQQIVSRNDEKQAKDKLQCPTCRKEFAIPPEGVEGFQKNFFMHRLKEITAKTQTLETPSGIDLERVEDCPQHKTEERKMYCSDCKELVCMEGFADKHQDHKFSSVEKVGETFRRELKAVASKIETCLNESFKTLQQCIYDKTNFQENVNSIEEKVINRKNELIDLIDESAKSLLGELASIQQTRLKQIQSEIDENERQLVIIESFKVNCKKIETKGTNEELCQLVPTLRHKAEKIQQTQESLCRRSTHLIQLQFEQTNFGQISNSGNAIGKIEVVSEFIRSCVKLDIPSPSRVQGVTKLENKICVLCRQPNEVLIFQDQNSFDLQTLIDIKQIENPWDIASCEISKCLYIKEELTKNIWKITIEDSQVTKWLTFVRRSMLGEVISIYGSVAGYSHEITRQSPLSVTSEGYNLLLTTFVRIGQYSSKLDIYNSDAKVIRDFSLPTDIYAPLQIICKPNGEFIVSHFERTYYTSKAIISRLTSDGQTVIGRNSLQEQTVDLKEPRHLTLDSDNNRLFVADCKKDCVIILDSDSLNLKNTLLTKNKNDIDHPSGLFYDAKKKQLIVGHSSNKVDVYELT